LVSDVGSFTTDVAPVGWWLKTGTLYFLLEAEGRLSLI